MQRILARPDSVASFTSVLILVSVVAAWTAAAADDGRDSLNESPASGRVGLTERVPWTTSRIAGSPDPPSPYRIERLYPGLSFDQPVEMIDYPDGEQVCVVERRGAIHLFKRDQSVESTERLLDGSSDIDGLAAAYGLAFHPEFATNRLCYVCYILGPDLPDGTRVSQFRVTETDPPRIDPTSEQILLTWRSGGHNGGSLKFGPDGYLYISTGDASPPSPPDVHDTGQDVGDLLASVLRIDVDHPSDGAAYGIPADNPFVETPGAAPEVWAYGFRNPWRTSFDRATGDLWLGDVGWQLWEMVYRVQPGGNYGWSVKEGPQVVRPESRRGPTAILPPVIAHPRAEAASVTGGYVYRGTRLEDLSGAYVYGDYVTGKIWGLRDDGQGATWHEELVDTPVAIICFYEGPDGEIALVGYNSGQIFRLAPNDAGDEESLKFPRRLSETGLFESTSDHLPAAGVVPFSINAEQWADHATAERYVAVPGDETIVLKQPRERVPTDWGTFPEGMVLVKTLSLETERGNPQSSRRIETQILHRISDAWRDNSGEWRGYTYVWNEDQTDAVLAPKEGMELEFEVADASEPGGVVNQTWRVSGRTECYFCHNPWAGYRLAFTPAQLDKLHDYDGLAASQVDTLEHIGLLSRAAGGSDDRVGFVASGAEAELRSGRLVDPHDETADLDDRARSYLHANCAHCHRFGGGGTAVIDLRVEAPLDEMRLIGTRPTQGAFRIPGAALVAPGRPTHSVLYYRTAKLGRGRMPYTGSQIVDQRGIALLADWIQHLDSPSGEVEAESSASGSLTEEAVDELLGTTSGALGLMHHVQSLPPADPLRLQIARRASGHELPEIRDLFERFLPAEERLRRLGATVDQEEILRRTGSAERGRALFFETAGVQCKSCHRIGSVGTPIGPDLTKIAERLNRRKLLESIVEPSKTIDPKYVPYLVETRKGQVHSGLLVEKTETQVVLRTTKNEQLRFEADELEFIVPQSRSLMPDLIYQDMTAEQLADLLAYLETLK